MPMRISVYAGFENGPYVMRVNKSERGHAPRYSDTYTGALSLHGGGGDLERRRRRRRNFESRRTKIFKGLEIVRYLSSRKLCTATRSSFFYTDV